MIRVDPQKCSGCLRCQVNCSFFHTGRVGRNRARVKVVKIEAIGVDYPVMCQQCEEHYCTRCPESAIEIGVYGQIIVSPTLCVSCGTCETLCPIGAIQLYDDIPYVCDLCGGEPRCVAQCNMQAIWYEPDHAGVITLKLFKKKSRGQDPQAKRLNYAIEMTKELRKRWKSSTEA